MPEERAVSVVQVTLTLLLFFCLFCFLYFVQKDNCYEAEPRSSFIEGARDIAILEAMLESGMKQGAPIEVKRI